MDQDQNDAEAKETEEERQAHLAQKRNNQAFINECVRGTVEEAEASIAAGADAHEIIAHYTTIDGDTLLHVAATREMPALIQLLINMNAQVNALANKKTALHCLVNHELKQTNLPLPSIADVINTANILITNKADVNATTDNGWTPLQLALRHRYSHQLIPLLLEHNADIDAKNKFGHTALRWAIARNNLDLVQMLIARGACIDTGSRAKITLNEVATQTKKALNDANEERKELEQKHTSSLVDHLTIASRLPVTLSLVISDYCVPLWFHTELEWDSTQKASSVHQNSDQESQVLAQESESEGMEPFS